VSGTCVKSKPAAASFVLEDFAPYRIVALGHAISGRLSGVYRDENITIPEWRVLAVISQSPRVAARDVVSRTPMDKMTVSRAVASLEAKGFVDRQADDKDRRVSSLSLTREGRVLFDKIAVLALDAEIQILAALTPQERMMFLSTLSKLEEHATVSE